MSINRREFLGSALAGAAILTLNNSVRAESAKKEKLNFVLIVADDLGYCDTQLEGCGTIPTPNINSIGKNGVIFPQAYVTSPVCSPSRAGFLTGRYGHRYGFEFNAGPYERAFADKEMGLPTNEITLADVLRKAGYKTGLVGKWHLGLHPKFHPQSRGFDEYFGFLFGANSYIEPKTPNGISDKDLVAIYQKDRTERNPILRGREIIDEPEYLTDAFARENIAFIERHKKEPFFLYAAFNAVHDPYQTLKKYYDRFPEIKDEKKRIYASMVSSLDDAVGEILTKLKKEKLDKNTVVIFISDNGCAFYTNACANDPLKAGKLTPFEGGVRIPYAIQWTGGIKGGQKFDKPISTLDLFPTITKLAGAEMPTDREYDGVDLLPFLSGKITTDPHEILFWRNGENYGIRYGNYKMIRVSGKDYLFDIRTDISEQKIINDTNKDVVAEIGKRLAAWESKMKPPMWSGREGFTQTFDGIVMKILI